ncbi:hypothetical protein ACRAWD_27570 [Caulobacter segnis]
MVRKIQGRRRIRRRWARRGRIAIYLPAIPRGPGPEARCRLLEETAFEQITIREVVQRAGVGYLPSARHFADKQALARRGLACRGGSWIGRPDRAGPGLSRRAGLAAGARRWRAAATLTAQRNAVVGAGPGRRGGGDLRCKAEFIRQAESRWRGDAGQAQAGAATWRQSPTPARRKVLDILDAWWHRASRSPNRRRGWRPLPAGLVGSRPPGRHGRAEAAHGAHLAAASWIRRPGTGRAGR